MILLLVLLMQIEMVAYHFIMKRRRRNERGEVLVRWDAEPEEVLEDIFKG